MSIREPWAATVAPHGSRRRRASRALVVAGTLVPMVAFGAVAHFYATFAPFGMRSGWWQLDSGGILLLAIVGAVAGLRCARRVADGPRTFWRAAAVWGACALLSAIIPRRGGADLPPNDLMILAGGTAMLLAGRRVARTTRAPRDTAGPAAP